MNAFLLEMRVASVLLKTYMVHFTDVSGTDNNFQIENSIGHLCTNMIIFSLRSKNLVGSLSDVADWRQFNLRK